MPYSLYVGVILHGHYLMIQSSPFLLEPSVQSHTVMPSILKAMAVSYSCCEY